MFLCYLIIWLIYHVCIWMNMCWYPTKELILLLRGTEYLWKVHFYHYKFPSSICGSLSKSKFLELYRWTSSFSLRFFSPIFPIIPISHSTEPYRKDYNVTIPPKGVQLSAMVLPLTFSLDIFWFIISKVLVCNIRFQNTWFI